MKAEEQYYKQPNPQAQYLNGSSPDKWRLEGVWDYKLPLFERGDHFSFSATC